MSERKVILVTGMSGAGKTTYARSLGAPVIAFDDIHDYGTGKTDYETLWRWVLRNLDSPVIVVDAWRIRLDPGLDVFRFICCSSGRSCEVHTVYTSPLELFLGQRGKAYSMAVCTLRQHATEWSVRSVRHTVDQVFPINGCHLRWMFRQADEVVEYPNEKHLFDTAGSDPVVELLSWIDATSDDPHYQTIELDGEVIRQGYTESEKSWERIQAWGIDWTGKVVGDVGCFNGYFCFKAEEAGATEVIGYDKGEGPIAIASRLSVSRWSQCWFLRKDVATEPLERKLDICLVLNALHHIAPDPRSKAGVFFLGEVFRCSGEAIFEIERDAEEVVTEAAGRAGFTLAHEAESHRVTDKGARRLLHFVKGNGE